jgi:hypothetical protein
VKKSDLLRAIQREIRRHDFNYFVDQSPSLEAEAFVADPHNWPTYEPDVARWCLTCGFVHAVNPAWLIG